MGVRYAIEAVGNLDGSLPRAMMNGAVLGGLRRLRASYDLSSAAVTTADQILLGELPQGSVFAYGVITASVTLGTSVIAIGTNQVHASNGQYRAAATQTAVETPALFGITTAIRANPTTGRTLVWLTVATATLPGTGILTVDIIYSGVEA